MCRKNVFLKACVFDVNATFFILPLLSTFDGTIGLDLLKQTKAELDFENKQIVTISGSEELNRCAFHTDRTFGNIT